MYAAMPAVLKNAIENSYEDCGWNLLTSENKYGEKLYPHFADVARNVKSIIDSSEYDADNKGAYKGSLLTRLHSLTNGINGLIFTTDKLPMEALFDENAVVDLSRVGSSETKSLIMGMLVLKLQEHRMTQGEMNAPLTHITVLEEAHNLLKRTSTEQISESASLVGKSVEMISNAIAEMRTYGEGFIIADQSPGLLDMTAIRNTNTKIIMRLPDISDRELVGKSANLNDEQIAELAKLPCGVGAVYQNEWIQPVLCKVEKYDSDIVPFTYTPGDDLFSNADDREISKALLDSIMNKELWRNENKNELKSLKEQVIKSKLETIIKCEFLDYIDSENKAAMDKLRTLLYDLLAAEEAILMANECDNIYDWVHTVVENLNPSLENYSRKQIDVAMALILYEKSSRNAEYNNIFCKFTEVYKSKGGVF